MFKRAFVCIIFTRIRSQVIKTLFWMIKIVPLTSHQKAVNLDDVHRQRGDNVDLKKAEEQ